MIFQILYREGRVSILNEYSAGNFNVITDPISVYYKLPGDISSCKDREESAFCDEGFKNTLFKYRKGQWNKCLY